jgi:hypothetical protein
VTVTPLVLSLPGSVLAVGVRARGIVGHAWPRRRCARDCKGRSDGGRREDCAKSRRLGRTFGNVDDIEAP